MINDQLIAAILCAASYAKSNFAVERCSSRVVEHETQLCRQFVHEVAYTLLLKYNGRDSYGT